MQLSTAYFIPFFISLIAYGLASFLFSLRVVFNREGFALYGLKTVLAAFFIHFVCLVLHLYGQDYPYILSQFDIYQLISLLIVMSYLLLSVAYKFLGTGIILIPVSLIFFIISLTQMVALRTPGHFLENSWAFIHLVFIFMAMAVFIVSFITAILYLIQEHTLKSKKLIPFIQRLPALEVMEKIHYRSLYIGFVFFTFGLITGGGWSKSIYGVYLTNSVRDLMSFFLWVFFALFLNLRMARGWVGRKGVVLSFVGLVGVLFLLTWVG